MLAPHGSWAILGSMLVQFLLLPSCTQASLISTLLFGKDTLDPVRAAIKQTEQMRQEAYGWYHHNLTQQANFTVTPDPLELYTLLPANYGGRSLVDPDGSYYKNVEGYYKGDWTGWDYSTQRNRSVALDSRLNHTAAQQLSEGWNKEQPIYLDGALEEKLLEDRGEFDWLTVKSAHVDVHLKEEHLLSGNVSLITGSLSFTAPANSKSTVESVDFSLEGLHFIPTGSVFLHAVGDEAPHGTDVRTSLGLIPHDNNGTANATISAIDKAFQLRIDMLQRIIDSGSYDAGDPSTEPVPVKHNCSLHIYGQLQSAGLHAQMQPQIDAIESELVNATGISTISPPPLHLSLLAYSPECQLVLTSPRLTGLLQTQLWKKAVHYAILYLIVLFVQTYLLVQQMEATTTPSGLSKVSDKTWLAQSLLDAYGCLIHLSVAVVLENETTLPLIACSFMSGMCFLAFGYRYTIVIYRTQMDASPAPAPAATTATTATTATENGQETTAGATANEADTTAGPANLISSTIASITAADAASATPEEIQARRRGARVLLVGLFLFMVGFFPILTVTLMLPVLYSFWIPQIYRNFQRGTRKAILKRCVVGTTLSRLFIPLYLLVCPDNVMFSEPSVWGWVLAAYLVGQAAVLIGQDLLGPHWFVPHKWVPVEAIKAWEYHPSPEGEEEYGDCAICLTAIERRRARDGGKKRRSGWLESLSSNRSGYDPIAENAEDFGVGDDSEALYPPEKGRRGSRAGRYGSGSGVGRRVRPYLARSIRLALRWKQDLGATSTLLGRRMDVMVAPCHHAFHTECLERWLEIKNECPSCRSVLPSV